MSDPAAPRAPSPTARRIIDLLSPHTPFAEAIVRRQSERSGLSLASLEESDLGKVGPLIVQAASVFLDPPVLAKLRAALRLT